MLGFARDPLYLTARRAAVSLCLTEMEDGPPAPSAAPSPRPGDERNPPHLVLTEVDFTEQDAPLVAKLQETAEKRSWAAIANSANKREKPTLLLTINARHIGKEKSKEGRWIADPSKEEIALLLGTTPEIIADIRRNEDGLKLHVTLFKPFVPTSTHIVEQNWDLRVFLQAINGAQQIAFLKTGRMIEEAGEELLPAYLCAMWLENSTSVRVQRGYKWMKATTSPTAKFEHVPGFWFISEDKIATKKDTPLVAYFHDLHIGELVLTWSNSSKEENEKPSKKPSGPAPKPSPPRLPNGKPPAKPTGPAPLPPTPPQPPTGKPVEKPTGLPPLPPQPPTGNPNGEHPNQLPNPPTSSNTENKEEQPSGQPTGKPNNQPAGLPTNPTSQGTKSPSPAPLPAPTTQEERKTDKPTTTTHEQAAEGFLKGLNLSIAASSSNNATSQATAPSTTQNQDEGQNNATSVQTSSSKGSAEPAPTTRTTRSTSKPTQPDSRNTMNGFLQNKKFDPTPPQPPKPSKK